MDATAGAALWPLASRDDLARTLRPMTESVESSMRTLRKHGLVGDGIELRIHRDGRLEGRVRYYTALSVWAALALRTGQDRIASRYGQAAINLERKWSTHIRATLGTATDPTVLLAPSGDRAISMLLTTFADQLAHRIGTLPAPVFPDVEILTGELIGRHDGRMFAVFGRQGDTTLFEIALPEDMAGKAGIELSSKVVLIQETLRSGTVLSELHQAWTAPHGDATSPEDELDSMTATFDIPADEQQTIGAALAADKGQVRRLRLFV